MTNKILIKQKTIIMTIGITNCGKSYFCTNHLIPFLNSHKDKLSYKYLSSDEIRRDLLNNNDLHKHDIKMLQVSAQAFSILINQLDNYTSYPVNTDVVVVDTTAVSIEGRKFIFEIANKNNYNVVGILFDYRVRDEYFKYSEGVSNKKIANTLTIFKEKTLKELERKNFENIYKISHTDFSSYTFIYEESGINKPDVNLYERYTVVGDIHGCFDELLECVMDDKGLLYDKKTGLLTMTNFTKYHHHILVGDYLDKGPKIKETIKFLYDNRQFFWIVRGNHENFVYKFLKGELGSYENNLPLIKSWFDSVDLLINDEEYKKLFFELYENSFDFIEGEKFIVTHAPCDIKYLGKTDNKSIKSQRNFVYPKKINFDSEIEYIEKREESFQFLLNQADSIHPIHFFGHVMVKDYFSYKNKYNLDTGCVVGNKLTTATINSRQFKPFIKSYLSKQEKTEELNILFTLKHREFNFEQLDIELQRRLRWGATNKLNFISGTMSPCDKFDTELESLEAGINYYYDLYKKNKSVKKIILQPKFMGSRVNLLLHKTDLDQCKAFSRQGYLINNDRLSLSTEYTLTDLFKDLQLKYIDVFESLEVEKILFDGELLPWDVMGSALIEKDFILPAHALNSELNLLKNIGFYNELSHFTKKYKESSELKPHEQNYINWYNEFSKELQPFEVQKENLEKYLDQINFFAKKGKLEYKPFSILKFYNSKGLETNAIRTDCSNIDIFKLISSEPHCIVDFEDNSIILVGYQYPENRQKIELPEGNNVVETGLKNQIKEFWDFITKNNHMEGVVIKPEFAYIHGVAPYLKCRNEEYLRLTYGIDYKLPHKYDSLIRKKTIKSKLSTSIKEWVLGKKLLEINEKDISIENKEWVSLMVQLMEEQERERELDPRL